MGTEVELSVTVESLTTAPDFALASELYREVFGLAGPEMTINPRLMSSLRRYGGSVIGAKDREGRLVGFAYGFVGADAAKLFHYSQAVVIAPSHQHRGLGRLLKEAQRKVAIETGLDTMRWAFDPWLARNAHFNLDVLGATGRWFSTDLYDTEASGGERSNRLTVEWEFRSAARREPIVVPEFVSASAADWGRDFTDGRDAVWIPIPADPGAARDDDDHMLGRERLAHTLGAAISAGAEVVSCTRFGPESAAYRCAIPPEGPAT